MNSKKSPQKKATALSAMILSALLLTSCGPKSPNADKAATASDAKADTSQVTMADVEKNKSPLTNFLGIDALGGQTDQEAERQRVANRAVTQCMAKEGFQYSPPNVENQSFQSGAGTENEHEYWSQGWVEKYGLGVSTTRFSQSAVGPNLVGYVESNDVSNQSDSDPNAAYLKTLSEAEREAYQTALYGASFSSDGSGGNGEGEAMSGPEGCFGAGFAATYGDMVGKGEQLFTQFGDAFEQLEARINADSRVVQWRKDISLCMAKKGHTFNDMADARKQIESELSAIRTGTEAGTGNVDVTSMSEREIQQYYEQLSRISADQLPALKEIQTKEVALAKDLVECGGGELKEAIFMADIRKGYEEKFMQENQKDLAQFKGAFSQN